MKKMQTAAGFIGLVSIAIALNLALLREALFVPEVYVPLGLGLLSGLVWFVLKMVSFLRGGASGTPQYGFNTALSVLAFLGICIVLYAFTKRSEASWDLTREGRTELAVQTVQVLRSLDRDVEVTCFFVQSGEESVRLSREKTRRFLERCQRYTEHLKVEFVDPQREPARLQESRVLRVSPVGTIALESGTRLRVIPLSDVNSRLEERDFTNALINVSLDTSPKVYFLTGHGERDIADTDPKSGGSDFRVWLEKESYTVDRHIISVNDPTVPEDCAILVINGYASSFQPYEIDAMDEYTANGGRMLMLVNPQFVLNQTENPVENMRPWLERRFGIRIGSDVIVSKATQGYKVMFVPDFSILDASLGGAAFSAEFRGSFNREHPITRVLDKQLVLALVRSVTLDTDLPDDVSGHVLLRTTPDTWAETDLSAVVEGQGIQPDAHETPGPNGIAVAVSLRTAAQRNDPGLVRDGRIVVIGDADLSSNEAIAHVGNHGLLLNTIAWLSEREDLIAIRPTGEQDPPIILNAGQQRAIAWIAALGPVQAVAVFGMIAFMLRRRHQ